VVQRNRKTIAAISPPKVSPGASWAKFSDRAGDLWLPGDGFVDDLEAIQAAHLSSWSDGASRTTRLSRIVSDASFALSTITASEGLFAVYGADTTAATPAAAVRGYGAGGMLVMPFD
jgi:hypothetical protein